jgi:hypothetical protein
MSKLTWENITSNLEDALEELKSLDSQLLSGEMPDEVELRIALQHIYHHINFAWNTRHISPDAYANLTRENFDLWGKFPEDIEW